MPTDDHARREARARRAAHGRGLTIRMSNGQYLILDQRLNAVVAGGGPLGPSLDLDDVEGFLTTVTE